MGVEPTLDQEAGRATVLKTAEHLFQAAPAAVTGSHAVQIPNMRGPRIAAETHSWMQFGVKSDVKKRTPGHSRLRGPCLAKGTPRRACDGDNRDDKSVAAARHVKHVLNKLA